MPARIAYLDGRRLSRAIVEGARSVVAQKAPLDAINVFPVPDGDTGSNLAATLSRVAARLSAEPPHEVGIAARAAADEALLAARGNSGAIFAQFFEGLADGLRGLFRAGPVELGEAAVSASRAARAALARPREGTIVSVIHEWARRLEDRSRSLADFAELIPDSLEAARRALRETPEQLPVLKKAGVVDAGGQGFVAFLEGVTRSLGTRRDVTGPEAVWARIEEARLAVPRRVTGAVERSLLFRYCAEILIEGEGLDRDGLRRAAAPLGDSLAVVGGARRVRLHIHVNRPEDVFDVARRFGRPVETKVEDMHEQAARGGVLVSGAATGAIAGAGPGGLVVPRTARVAVVTDSACDLPESELESSGITVVPLRLYIAEDAFLDKVTISTADFHRKLLEEGAVPRTSQPPPADFREVYRAFSAHGVPVVGVHVSGALSGTLDAARSAAASLGRESGLAPIQTVDSKGVSIAQGLVVREAVRAAASGGSVEEVVAAARSAAERTRVMVAVTSLDYLVRGGRVGRVRGRIARLLGLLPVLGIVDGRAVKVASARSFEGALSAVVEGALRATANVRAPEFGVAHFAAGERAERVAAELVARRPGASAFVVDAAPAISAHAGPGAVAVGYLLPR